MFKLPLYNTEVVKLLFILPHIQSFVCFMRIVQSCNTIVIVLPSPENQLHTYFFTELKYNFPLPNLKEAVFTVIMPLVYAA